MSPRRSNNRRYHLLAAPASGDIYTPSPYRKHSLLNKSAPSAAYIKKWRYRSSSTISAASKTRAAQQPHVVFPLASIPPTSFLSGSESPTAEEFLICLRKKLPKKKTKHAPSIYPMTTILPPISALPSPSLSASPCKVLVAGCNHVVSEKEERFSSTTPPYKYDEPRDSSPLFRTNNYADPLAYFRTPSNVPFLPTPFTC